jgi:arylformamidase
LQFISGIDMARKIIDISVAISPGMLVYPGDPKPSVEKVFSIKNDGFAVSTIYLGTHTGTHIDAPSHIIEDGASIDMVALDSFYGRAVVFDLSYIGRDVSASDLEAHLEQSAVFKNNLPVILLLKTIGFSTESEVSKEQYSTVGFDETVGQWILDSKFKTVGVDTFSIDSDLNLPNHKLLLQHNVSIIENLNMVEVKEGIYDFICFPLKLIGCDASPARAILVELEF